MLSEWREAVANKFDKWIWYAREFLGLGRGKMLICISAAAEFK